MADVKDDDIVFEYPDDDEIPGTKVSEEKEKPESESKGRGKRTNSGK